MSLSPDASAFGDPLAALEAHIAAADARGEPVPPEAREMLVKLRELVAALSGLSASLEELNARVDRRPEPNAGDQTPEDPASS